MIGCSLRTAARNCSASAAAWTPTSPSARRWASRCCTRGRTGSRAGTSRRRARGRHRPGATPLRLDATACRCTACSARRAAGASSTTTPRRRRHRDLRLAPTRADGAFPFPHAALEATLAADDTDDRDDGQRDGRPPVPIAFGFHPYLQLPGRHRARLARRDPGHRAARARRRDAADRRARRRARSPPGRSATRTFDDAYAAPRSARSRSKAAAGGSSSRSSEGYPLLAGVRAARATR